MIGTDAFQECDALGLAKPVTKHCAQLRDPNAVVVQLRAACELALGGRPGPVLLDFPKDVQLAPLSKWQRPELLATSEPPEPAPAPVAEALALLAEARRRCSMAAAA